MSTGRGLYSDRAVCLRVRKIEVLREIQLVDGLVVVFDGAGAEVEGAAVVVDVEVVEALEVELDEEEEVDDDAGDDDESVFRESFR